MDTKKLTAAEIAEIVIVLLAEVRGVPPGVLRAELEAAGSQLPVDSVLIAEILTRVEDVCGVRVDVDAEAARSTRSVVTFARTVYQALPDERAA